MQVAKQCRDCGETKPLFEFNSSSGRTEDGYKSRCRTCERARRTQYKYDCVSCGKPVVAWSRGTHCVPCGRIKAAKARGDLVRGTSPSGKPALRRARVATNSWLRVVRRHMPCPGCGHFTKPRAKWCSYDCFRANTYVKPAEQQGRTIRSSTRKAVFVRDGFVCQLCNEPTSQRHDPYDDLAPELDHIVPWSEGGRNQVWNLRVTHRVCNRDRNLT